MRNQTRRIQMETAQRTTVTKYRFNSKVGGFQPTNMVVTIHDTVKSHEPIKEVTKEEATKDEKVKIT
jgi:hypothetical protein